MATTTRRSSRPTASRPTRAARPSAGLRLTRRGRAALFGSVVFTVLGSAIALGQGAVASVESAGPATEIVVVQPGQSLWTVAQQVDPTADPRAVIERIRELNDVESSTVYPGQALVVPRRG